MQVGHRKSVVRNGAGLRRAMSSAGAPEENVEQHVFGQVGEYKWRGRGIRHVLRLVGGSDRGESC